MGLVVGKLVEFEERRRWTGLKPIRGGETMKSASLQTTQRARILFASCFVARPAVSALLAVRTRAAHLTEKNDAPAALFLLGGA